MTTMKNIVGQTVLDGSPGYQTREVIAEVNSKEHDLELVFESGCFCVLSHDELYELIDDGEVHFTDGNHGGMRIITLVPKGTVFLDDLIAEALRD